MGTARKRLSESMATERLFHQPCLCVSSLYMSSQPLVGGAGDIVHLTALPQTHYHVLCLEGLRGRGEGTAEGKHSTEGRDVGSESERRDERWWEVTNDKLM